MNNHLCVSLLFLSTTTVISKELRKFLFIWFFNFWNITFCLVNLNFQFIFFWIFLANYIPICKRSSPAFNMCIKMATVIVQPYISQGIKELNIPAIEPLEIPMVKLEQGTPAVNYKATLTNIRIYGLSKYKFLNFM